MDGITFIEIIPFIDQKKKKIYKRKNIKIAYPLVDLNLFIIYLEHRLLNVFLETKYHGTYPTDLISEEKDALLHTPQQSLTLEILDYCLLNSTNESLNCSSFKLKAFRSCSNWNRVEAVQDAKNSAITMDRARQQGKVFSCIVLRH